MCMPSFVCVMCTFEYASTKLPTLSFFAVSFAASLLSWSSHLIYMDPCPHSDLKRRHKRHRNFRFAHPRVGINLEVLTLSRLYKSEPFLDIFHYLVQVAVTMWYGPTDNGWGNYEIAHPMGHFSDYTQIETVTLNVAPYL